MQEFILNKQGAVSNLKLTKISRKFALKPNEVLIKQTAIGVNHLDVHFRNGTYGLNKTPIILGTEACGVIKAVGDKVVDFKVGQRVAYATGELGAYTQARIMPEHLLIKVPKDISDEVAAGSLLKGLMAHTLLYRTYVAVRAKKILVHGAAGGVGQFLCPWAKSLGIEVIGTVGSDEKAQFAKNNGCDHVINYTKNDFVKEVKKVTKGGGVGLVYDNIGKDTLLKSLSCLWPMGMCVSYGEVSGDPEPLDLNRLLINSLYITKPTLALYKSNRVELALGAAEVFARIKKGILKPKITTYPFKDLPKVHKKIEKRQVFGSQVLLFDTK